MIAYKQSHQCTDSNTGNYHTTSRNDSLQHHRTLAMELQEEPSVALVPDQYHNQIHSEEHTVVFPLRTTRHPRNYSHRQHRLCKHSNIHRIFCSPRMKDWALQCTLHHNYVFQHFLGIRTPTAPEVIILELKIK